MSIKFRNPIHDLLYDIVDEDEVRYAQQHPDEFLEPGEYSKMLACIVENKNLGTRQLEVYSITRPLTEEDIKEQEKTRDRIYESYRKQRQEHEEENRRMLEEAELKLKELLEKKIGKN